MAAVTDQIVQRLKETDPSLDLREGTAMFELLVKPLAMAIEPLRSEIEQIRNFQSIAFAPIMPEDELDLLASNFFINRKIGARAKVSIRVFVTEPIALTFGAGAIFTAQNGQKFSNASDFTFTKAEVRNNVSGELFFFDVTAFSLERTEAANIGENEIVSLGVEIPGFAGMTNSAVSIRSSRTETNAELVARVKRSITLRNLVSHRGISTVLSEFFPDLFEVRSIGFTDPEMHRDITLGVHTGGRVDVYVDSSAGFEAASNVFRAAPLADTENASGLHITVKKGGPALTSIVNVPLMRITSVEAGTIQSDGSFDAEEELLENADFSMSVKDVSLSSPNFNNAGRHFRFSTMEHLDIQLDKKFKDRDIRVSYEWAPFVSDPQDFVNVERQRVTCSDVLVKAFIPAFIDISLSVIPLPGKDSTLFNPAIEEFIQKLPSPTVFELSDVVALLYDIGADKVDLPTKVSAVVHKPDGTIAVVATENAMDFSSVTDTTIPITPRIIKTHVGTVTVSISSKPGLIV